MKQTNEQGQTSDDVLSAQPLEDPVVIADPSSVPMHDPYLALRDRNYLLYLIGVLILTLGQKMLEVAIGWELYERTGSALMLGYVGLVLIIPVFCFSLPAGYIADHFNRKRILLITLIVGIVSSLGLTILSLTHGPLLLIYGCLLLMGGATAFGSPASSALVSQLIPETSFENAATWNSSSWQLASVVGPALGGFLVAWFHGATQVYMFNALATVIFVVLLICIHERKRHIEAPPADKSGTTVRSIVEGLSFLRKDQIILGAITLDMFAVLLGGATTLLPIFAKDILQVGPEGLGWLRAAPSVGAISVALFLAHRPPFKHAGRTLLLVVAGFGIATAIFGLSRSFWLSLVMLLLLGGLDNVSVVIRSTLLLMRTPDSMRGRVSAVNSLFIGASNELGGFESGLTAQIFNPAISVVGGGIGTVLVVALVAILFPALRHLTTLRAGTE